MNEPSLLAQYNAAGRRVAEMEHQLQALRGENILLRRRVELLTANIIEEPKWSDNHGHWCYNR